jgi:hypothetical protein
LGNYVASRVRTVQIDAQSDPRWEEFISNHPDAIVYHHPAWLRVLELEYGRKTINLSCEDEAGQIRGVLPLLQTAGVPFLGNSQYGPRLSSLPRTPIAGPLAADADARRTLLDAAIELVQKQPGLRLQLKVSGCDGLDSIKPLVLVPWRVSYVLLLAEDTEKLRFSRRVRWQVSAARSRGVVVQDAETEDDLFTWYGLYLETMRWHLVPPRPYRFFQAQWDLLRPLGVMKLLLAKLRSAGETRTVAGSIFLSFGRTVFYAFNGVHRDDFSLHGNDLVQWHAIRQACFEGFRFMDFGEVPAHHHGLARYKLKWGAQPQPLFRALYPALSPGREDKTLGRLHKLGAKGWRRVPLRTTAAIGDFINSFL